MKNKKILMCFLVLSIVIVSLETKPQSYWEKFQQKSLMLYQKIKMAIIAFFEPIAEQSSEKIKEAQVEFNIPAKPILETANEQEKKEENLSVIQNNDVTRSTKTEKLEPIAEEIASKAHPSILGDQAISPTIQEKEIIQPLPLIAESQVIKETTSDLSDKSEEYCAIKTFLQIKTNKFDRTEFALQKRALENFYSRVFMLSYLLTIEKNLNNAYTNEDARFLQTRNVLKFEAELRKIYQKSVSYLTRQEQSPLYTNFHNAACAQIHNTIYELYRTHFFNQLFFSKSHSIDQIYKKISDYLMQIQRTSTINTVTKIITELNKALELVDALFNQKAISYFTEFPYYKKIPKKYVHTIEEIRVIDILPRYLEQQKVNIIKTVARNLYEENFLSATIQISFSNQLMTTLDELLPLKNLEGTKITTYIKAVGSYIKQALLILFYGDEPHYFENNNGLNEQKRILTDIINFMITLVQKQNEFMHNAGKNEQKKAEILTAFSLTLIFEKICLPIFRYIQNYKKLLSKQDKQQFVELIKIIQNIERTSRTSMNAEVEKTFIAFNNKKQEVLRFAQHIIIYEFGEKSIMQQVQNKFMNYLFGTEREQQFKQLQKDIKETFKQRLHHNIELFSPIGFEDEEHSNMYADIEYQIKKYNEQRTSLKSAVENAIKLSWSEEHEKTVLEIQKKLSEAQQNALRIFNHIAQPEYKKMFKSTLIESQSPDGERTWTISIQYNPQATENNQVWFYNF